MSVDKPGFKKMFDQGSGKKMVVKSISDDQVQVGTDHAVIGYIINLAYDENEMTCACTSTWLKEHGNWACAMHTESDMETK